MAATVATRASCATIAGPRARTASSARNNIAIARPAHAISARSARVNGAPSQVALRAIRPAKASARALSVRVNAAGMGDFSANSITGKETALSTYVGKVCLVVNVASAWGLTAQNYKELVTLYNKYKSQGFEVLAFPCNQFGGQEPGSDADVKKFAEGYGSKFPMFSKIDVNGPNTHPFYKYLKDTKGSFPSSDIKWNFGKFLVDKNGTCINRYAPTDAPMSIAGDIEAAL